MNTLSEDAIRQQAEKDYIIRDGDYAHMTDETIKQSRVRERAAFTSGANYAAAQSQWIEIKEGCEMPEFREQIIGFDAEDNTWEEYMYNGDGEFIWVDHTSTQHPVNYLTHWQRIKPPVKPSI